MLSRAVGGRASRDVPGGGRPGPLVSHHGIDVPEHPAQTVPPTESWLLNSVPLSRTTDVEYAKDALGTKQ
jgi:hypothetical protein